MNTVRSFISSWWVRGVRAGFAAVFALLPLLLPLPGGPTPAAAALQEVPPTPATPTGTSSAEEDASPVRGAPGWAGALEAFGQRLAGDVARDDVGGIVAGVAVDGDLVWAGAFGWADRERRLPMETSSVSRTGSISKPITAFLLLRLVEQGRVALDEPVVRHLPELRGLDDPEGHLEGVTFRRLASHQAGLIREPRLPDAATGPIEGWEAQLLRSIPATGFAQPPGTGTLYSNIGYGILGLALSRAAGRPFIELVEEEIFRPLGMTGSTFIVDETLAPRLAAGYLRRGDGTVDGSAPAREHRGRGYKVPNGGVYATVADLARFAAAASGTSGLDLLPEGLRRELLEVQPPSDPDRGYAVGFSVRVEADGQRIVSHGGSVAGYTAHMAFDPDAGISVILLRNYGNGATNLGAAAAGLLRELAGPGSSTSRRTAR